jgi:hypothetical protein
MSIGNTVVDRFRGRILVGLEPFGVWRILSEKAVVVWRPITPPRIAALTQRAFDAIDFDARGDSLLGSRGIADGATRGHQFFDQALVDFGIQPWIAQAP